MCDVMNAVTSQKIMNRHALLYIDSVRTTTCKLGWQCFFADRSFKHQTLQGRTSDMPRAKFGDITQYLLTSDENEALNNFFVEIQYYSKRAFFLNNDSSEGDNWWWANWKLVGSTSIDKVYFKFDHGQVITFHSSMTDVITHPCLCYIPNGV